VCCKKTERCHEAPWYKGMRGGTWWKTWSAFGPHSAGDGHSAELTDAESERKKFNKIVKRSEGKKSGHQKECDR